MSKVELKAHQLKQPGIMTLVSGRKVDLENFTENDVSIFDIAWGLGRTLRYGGHTKQDYTVAHHCIVMSYLVPERYAMEALLHDASEAYIGDIIYPVKALFPEVSEFENAMLVRIMDSFEVPIAMTMTRTGVSLYDKSAAVANADVQMLEHECFDLGRGGIYHPEVEKAFEAALADHASWWTAPQYAYIERYAQLAGRGTYFTEELGLKDEALKEWFPEDLERRKKEAKKEVVNG